jgi:mRNA-degrading endonuclease toxin of MazEF toxin-antitoxin module
LTSRYWSAPKPGDIVHCRFPEAALGVPGPKDRPALVIKVETYRDGSVDVEVAYGTSQGIDDVYPGELVMEKTDPDAGLQKDTKFDLLNIVRLPFNEEWFGPNPLERFGKHPKRGKLNLDEAKNKKKLHGAVTEARHVVGQPTRPRRRT